MQVVVPLNTISNGIRKTPRTASIRGRHRAMHSTLKSVPKQPVDNTPYIILVESGGGGGIGLYRDRLKGGP